MHPTPETAQPSAPRWLYLMPLLLALGLLAGGHLVTAPIAPAPTPTPAAVATSTLAPLIAAPPTFAVPPSPTPTSAPLVLAVEPTLLQRHAAALQAVSAEAPRLVWAIGRREGAAGALHALRTDEVPGEAIVLRSEPYLVVTNPRTPLDEADAGALLALVDQGTYVASSAPGEVSLLHELLGLETPTDLAELPDWSAVVAYVATRPGAWALVPWDAVTFRVATAAWQGVRYDPRAPEGYGLQRRVTLEAPAPLPLAELEALRGALRYSSEPAVELAAVGDVMLGRLVGERMAQFGWRYPFEGEGLQPLLAGADVALGNLECALSERGRAQPKTYTFRAPPSAVEALTYAGFDVMTLANNHTGDFGHDALRDTLETLIQAGIQPVGAGENLEAALRPVLLEANGLRLAILGFNEIGPRSFDATDTRPGSTYLDEETAVNAVRAAAREADLVIVTCHWGVEYANLASERQRRLAARLEETGAALVIGHHPHVVQGVRYGKTSLALYSLGNAVFDMGIPGTSEGVALRCLLDASGVKTFELVPFVIRASQPQVLEGDASRAVAERIARYTAQQGGYPAER